ncbi:hypothetical protein [uncultured Clostridium sp.]|uniref:hypothetical protein n=1 Tax=uncultured Clostridium sp. TaxID=59620 RepID=UPI002604A887|nr:hypothetical protein [uncultured Clostridium sp.]
MEEFKLNDLPIEFQDKYKELVEKYKIDRIFYIEDENKLLNLGDLEIEGYTMRMSKSLKTLLPIKKYFTIVLELKSRDNIKEPYWNFRIQILDKLLENN